MENSDKDELITLYDIEGVPFTLTKTQAQKYYADMQAFFKNMYKELAESVKGKVIIVGTGGDIDPNAFCKNLWVNPFVPQNEAISYKKYEEDMEKREKKSWFKEQLSLFPEEVLKEFELSATELRYSEDTKKEMFQDKVEETKDFDESKPNSLSKTSKEWQELYPEIKVLDPDGWDRSNFQYSWYEEKITFEEYHKRMMYSTCKGTIPLKQRHGTS